MEMYMTEEIKMNPDIRIEKVKNIVLLAYVVLETLYKTILGKYFMVPMEQLQCVAGALLIIVLLVEFIRLDGENKKKWLIKNSLVLVYFVIRGITFLYTGMQYTVLRSVFFEVVYMLALTEIVVNSQFCRKVVMKFFIGANLILNIFNIFFYWYCDSVIEAGTYATDSIYNFAEKYTYMGDFSYYNYCSMYSNPNQIGLMTGIAMLIALNYISKNMSTAKKICASLYYIFSFYCLWASNSSASHLAMVAAIGAFIIVKYVKVMTQKRIVVVCLLCAIVATGCIYAFIANQEEYGPYTETEDTLDLLSTKRYTIWKDSFYSHKEELILGCGNITLEKRDRYQYNLDKGIDAGFDINSSLLGYVGPHNGYIGMLSCTGILGCLAFLAAFLKKIKDAKSLQGKSYYYLALIFILVVNLFECMAIVSKNFCCLYLFLILAMDDNPKEVS